MAKTDVTLPPDRAEQRQPTEISAEIVRQVADRVYALWQRDLQVARERVRHTSAGRHWRR